MKIPVESKNQDIQCNDDVSRNVSTPPNSPNRNIEDSIDHSSQINKENNMSSGKFPGELGLTEVIGLICILIFLYGFK